MSWVYDYRVFAYVIALGSAFGVLAASIVTLQMTDGVDMSFTYARMGIASASITVLPLLFILLRDCVNRPVNSKTELIMIPLMSAFWLAAGGVTVVTRVNAFGHGPCDDIEDTHMNSLCNYAEPISTFSFVPAGLLLTYELLLLLIGTREESRQKPLWAYPVRELGPAKREAGR